MQTIGINMVKITEKEIQRQIDNLDFDERFCLKNVPDNLYHGSEGIGSTGMKEATKSMAHFQSYNSNNNDYSTATLKAFAIGSAVHTSILEPSFFSERYVLQPASIKVRRGKVWDEFKEAHSDKEILSSGDFELVKRMSRSAHELCGKFFTGGIAEKSYWYRHPTGIVLKARIDYEIGDAAIDLKTTADETPESFASTVKKRYAIQDSLYRLVSGLSDMVYVGICKSAPHSAFLCKQGDDVREQADQLIELTVEAILEADCEDKWPNYPLELIETELKPWELVNAI